MGAGYPKIWTTILSEPWFVKQSLNARGLYLLLLLIAKNGADTGQICTRSLPELAQMCGTDKRTLYRLLHKFSDDGKIKIEENSRHCLCIKIANYEKWQALSPSEVQNKLSQGQDKIVSSLSKFPGHQLTNKPTNKKSGPHAPKELPSSDQDGDAKDHPEFDFLTGVKEDSNLKQLENPMKIKIPPMEESGE